MTVLADCATIKYARNEGGDYAVKSITMRSTMIWPYLLQNSLMRKSSIRTPPFVFLYDRSTIQRFVKSLGAKKRKPNQEIGRCQRQRPGFLFISLVELGEVLAVIFAKEINANFWEIVISDIAAI